MMTPRIEKTLSFLKKSFEAFSDRYRYEHSIRVAHVGARIARAEGLDPEGFVIACLLHDIAYAFPHADDYDWYEHGRDGARIARGFLETLDMDPDMLRQICYGIAIHVDDRADFEGRRDSFSLSVSDADNIDRFDMLRLYFSLHYGNFHELKLEDKLSWLQSSLEKLRRARDFGFATATAKEMWLERVDYQIDFQTRLLKQLNDSFPEDF